METSKPESPAYAAFDQDGSSSQDQDSTPVKASAGKKCSRAGDCKTKCKGAKWFWRCHRCMRFPWMTVFILAFTIFLCIKSKHPARRISHEIKSLLENTDWHVCIKGPITRTFVGVIIVNLAISVMSIKANGFCKCPKKCKKDEDCRRRCRKNCCKWFIHWVALVAAYVFAVVVFTSVVGGAVVVAFVAAGWGVCNSGLTDLTSIVNTVSAAFQEWACTVHESSSDSSSSSEEWHHHHGHHHFKEKMCSADLTVTDQDVDNACSAADVMWHPGVCLVWIGFALAICQFTMAMIQRANLTTHNKAVEQERKQMWAAWKRNGGGAKGVSVQVEPEHTTPGGGETTAIRV